MVFTRFSALSDDSPEHGLEAALRVLWREFRNWRLREKEVVGANGFEPSTSWSRTRRSSQAEPRPDCYGTNLVISRRSLVPIDLADKPARPDWHVQSIAAILSGANRLA